MSYIESTLLWLSNRIKLVGDGWRSESDQKRIEGRYLRLILFWSSRMKKYPIHKEEDCDSSCGSVFTPL